MSEPITEGELREWRAGSKVTLAHPPMIIIPTEEELRWAIDQDARMILRLLDEVERLREQKKIVAQALKDHHLAIEGFTND